MNKLSPFQWASAAMTIAVLTLMAFAPAPLREGAIGLVLALYLGLSGMGVFAVRMNYYAEAVCRGKAGKKRIALTFDDGPDSETTPALLDLLKTHEAHATFFCVGQKAEVNPEIVKRIVAEGHTLGNHSYAHHWWTNFMTTRPLVREISRAQSVLHDLSGISPQYYRSPMGLANPHLAAALRETGLKLMGWDVRPFDRGVSAKTLVDRIAGTPRGAGPVRDASIVLLHDGGASRENLVDAVKEIMEYFQAQGYSFVSLEELLVVV